MSHLYELGYAAEDIISSVFRVCRNHTIPEYIMLEFIQVCCPLYKIYSFDIFKKYSFRK